MKKTLVSEYANGIFLWAKGSGRTEAIYEFEVDASEEDILEHDEIELRFALKPFLKSLSGMCKSYLINDRIRHRVPYTYAIELCAIYYRELKSYAQYEDDLFKRKEIPLFQTDVDGYVYSFETDKFDSGFVSIRFPAKSREGKAVRCLFILTTDFAKIVRKCFTLVENDPELKKQTDGVFEDFEKVLTKLDEVQESKIQATDLKMNQKINDASYNLRNLKHSMLKPAIWFSSVLVVLLSLLFVYEVVSDNRERMNDLNENLTKNISIASGDTTCFVLERAFHDGTIGAFRLTGELFDSCPSLQGFKKLSDEDDQAVFVVAGKSGTIEVFREWGRVFSTNNVVFSLVITKLIVFSLFIFLCIYFYLIIYWRNQIRKNGLGYILSKDLFDRVLDFVRRNCWLPGIK